MMVYVATSEYAIERDFLDRFARTCKRLGHKVDREGFLADDLSVLWGGPSKFDRIPGFRGPAIYCELGWLPRWGYQVSHKGINADHHLARPALARLSVAEEAAVEARLYALRNSSPSYGYMDVTAPVARGVPAAFILCPLQVETDTNMEHVPEHLRTAQGLIDELTAWNPPYPIVYKAHPSSFARHKYLAPGRPQDAVRMHQEGNVYGYLKHPGCQFVITLNSNVAHDALLWDVPVIALGEGFWPRDCPFYSSLPASLGDFWPVARSEMTQALRLSYARYVMDAQWSLEDAECEELVAMAIDNALLAGHNGAWGAMNNPRYKNLSKLRDAFASGELSSGEWVLVLDNDASWLSFVGDPPGELSGAALDSFLDQKHDEGNSLYYGNGQLDYPEAIAALGIPWEHC